MKRKVKGLIIAAGEGKRINSDPSNIIPKPNYIILGRPIMEWVILAMKMAGITEIFIVVGYKADEVMQKFGDGSKYDIKLRYIGNPLFKEDLIMSVYAARYDLANEDDFLLSMADHIFDPDILSNFLGIKKELDSVILCVDKKFEFITDMKDATKVKMDIFDKTKLVKSHKNLVDYDCIDCGLLRCSPIIFEAIGETNKEANTNYNLTVEWLAKNGKMGVWDLQDKLWNEVDCREDLIIAEKKMGTILTTKL